MSRELLRCMISTTPKQWCKWLPLAEYWYNTNYHTSLKTTPFQALYGFPPPHHSLGSYLDSTNIDVVEFLEQRQNFMETLRDNLVQAQNQMKLFADKKREEREFLVGDMVYLRLQPFRQNSVSLRKNLKLSSRYYGPYKVLERIGKVAYKLELPEGAKVHPVFHVSLLKKCLSKKHEPVEDLPEMDANGHYKIEPLSMLDSRQIRRKGEVVSQVLVAWLNADPKFNSWEDLKYLRRKFLTFDP